MTTADAAPWRVLVVDDDEAALHLSRCSSVTVDGRPLLLDLCRSAAEARARLAEHRYAVVIVDVVMETEHAGLDLVEELRRLPRHHLTQVIVRTGQPGAFPEARVLQDFRISDYWRKEDLQPQRMRTAVTGLIRSYETALSLEERSNERAALLREVHHRVKNNLQTIASLLSLQSERLAGSAERALIEESALRVRSMALVHDHLYAVDALDRIDLASYARALAAGLCAAVSPRATVEVLGEAVLVPVDIAVPVGLVLNELLANALKHGAPLGGRVVVELATIGDEVTAVVSDDGPGLPPGFDLDGGTSLGLQLVRSLARQVRGGVTAASDGGARFTLRVPRHPEG